MVETQTEERCGAVGHCWSIGLDSASSWSCTRTFHILLHAGLLHAEGDLWVLVAEHDVCNTRSWIARGVEMLVAITQAWMLVAQAHPTFFIFLILKLLAAHE